MDCSKCGKELKVGDRVFEFLEGFFDGEAVVANNSLEVWCEACDNDDDGGVACHG